MNSRRDFLKGIAGAVITVPAIVLAPRFHPDYDPPPGTVIEPPDPPPFRVREVRRETTTTSGALGSLGVPVLVVDETFEIDVITEPKHLPRLIDYMDEGVFEFDVEGTRLRFKGSRTCVGFDQHECFATFTGYLIA